MPVLRLSRPAQNQYDIEILMRDQGSSETRPYKPVPNLLGDEDDTVGTCMVVTANERPLRDVRTGYTCATNFQTRVQVDGSATIEVFVTRTRRVRAADGREYVEWVYPKASYPYRTLPLGRLYPISN